MMLNTNEKLPGIIYSLIARNTVVLVEYSSHEGNFSALAKRILLSIKSHDHKRTYTDKSGRFVFHYMVLDNLTYLCFATKGHKKAVCFAYLNEIYSRFVVAYTEKQILQAVSYTRTFIDFQKVLEREMKRYGKLESIPEPPKFSTPFENSPASNTSFDGNTSHSNYVEMSDFRDSQSVRPNLSRSSTISLLMQENEAVVDHKKNLSEPLLVKSDHTYSDKKIRSRCFYFFFFFLTLLLLVWLISSVACGFDYFCLRNRG